MLRELALTQLDRALSAAAPQQPRPKAGWLRAIRETLGMTTRQFAARVGVSQAAVMDAERAEARKDISLATLERYADALDCELQYVLRPRQPLQQMVSARAEQLARDEVARVRHSMALESQATSTDLIERQVADLKRGLLGAKRSRLWR